jgi:hypothetical protein
VTVANSAKKKKNGIHPMEKHPYLEFFVLVVAWPVGLGFNFWKFIFGQVHGAPLFLLAVLLVMFMFIGLNQVSDLVVNRRQDYFEKKGKILQSRIIHDIIARKSLYFIVPPLVLLVIISATQQDRFLDNTLKNYGGEGLIFLLQASLGVMLIMDFTYIWPSIVLSEYKFSLARACILIISEKNLDRVSSLKYLLLALNSYNAYMQKTINLQIRDMDKIYDKVCRFTPNQTDNLVKSFCSHLDKDQMGILLALSDRFTDPSGSDQFLVRKLFGEKIKNLIGVIIPIVTIIVTLIGLILKAKSGQW